MGGKDFRFSLGVRDPRGHHVRSSLVFKPHLTAKTSPSFYVIVADEKFFQGSSPNFASIMKLNQAN